MSELTLTQTESATKEADKLVEAEHGPCVFIEHPDGSRFGFKRIESPVYKLYVERSERGGDEAIGADEKLLQERCVYPSREEWNSYVARSVFEPDAYANAYHALHGAVKVRLCDASELPKEPAPLAAIHLTNGQIVVGFRKPGRAEVKMYKAHLLAKHNGEKQQTDPTEQILKNCAQGSEFSAWLESNPFGLAKFSDAFLEQFGMQEARVSGK